MSRPGQVVLKLLALFVAVSFLFGAVITAMPSVLGGVKDVTVAAAPTPDGGVREGPHYLHPTKAGPMPLPPAQPDAGKQGIERTYFPASKSMGGMGIPGDVGGFAGLGLRGSAVRPDAGSPAPATAQQAQP
ncbi:MAG: hypothetical protein ACOZQL_30840 [Myxococcota bacterium]